MEQEPQVRSGCCAVHPEPMGRTVQWLKTPEQKPPPPPEQEGVQDGRQPLSARLQKLGEGDGEGAPDRSRSGGTFPLTAWQAPRGDRRAGVLGARGGG